MNQGSATLATISTGGKVPETRFENAREVQSFVRRIIDNDSSRAFKRARVNGLVDGNPPYKASKLKEAGRSDACNVNWGKAFTYLESAVGSFYDLFAESPQYISVQSDYGTDEEKETYSRVISEEADRILREDKAWDYNIQISQWDMVLHGCGPLMFEDAQKVLPKAFLCGDLKLPEFAKSDTTYWEISMVQATYYPPELYEFIKDPAAASIIGWDVEYTKAVIANAMDIKFQQGQMYDWEFYQQELKNNSLSYYDDTKVCRIAHVFWKEFDGTVTQAMVERDSTVSNTRGFGMKAQDEKDTSVQFLFRKTGRYKSFQECVHPMYFSHGNGGFHHSVTGMGVRMFSAMEYQNRLLCNLSDKAFAAKILFKPTTTEGSQKFQLARFGDYAVLPPGFEYDQTPVSGIMNDGLAMNEEITNIVGENLSSFQRQPMKQEGNPVTAKQVQYDASQQSSLSKTQFNRYYEQLDMLYAEVYRRMSNLNTNDRQAKLFQERCRKRKVPTEALSRVRKVEATRVVGQGSAFMRKQAIDSLFSIAGSLPETGRDNLIADKIAAEAGQSAVSRYFPAKQKSSLSSDQQAEAMQWVGMMKIGIPPVITATQNPVIFATTFIQAAMQSIQSLQQGGDQMQVYKFLSIDGPAILAHLKRFASDPTKKQQFQQMVKTWKEIASVTDKLKKEIQQSVQQKKQQQQKTQAAMTDAQLKQAKLKGDMQLKQAKAAAQMKQSEEKHQLKLQQGIQDLTLKDATTAAEIHRGNMRSMQD
jgi:hypothetical protein